MVGLPRPGRVVRRGPAARADAGAAGDAYRFLWCWVAAYLVFFTFAGTKLPNYVLPLYAPAALLVARFLERWRRGAVEPNRRLLHAGLAGFALVGVVVAAGLLVAGGVLAPSLVKGQHLPGVEVWAAAGILPVAGAAAAWWLIRRGRRGPALAALGTAAVVFLTVMAGWGVAAVDAYKAPRPLVRAMLRDQSEGEIRVGCYHYFQPSLVFYARRDVLVLDDDDRRGGIAALPGRGVPVPAGRGVGAAATAGADAVPPGGPTPRPVPQMRRGGGDESVAACAA